MAVGWYEKDQSNVFLLHNSRVVRVGDKGDVIDEWSSIGDWLAKEISRLSIESKR